jgi:hypothetical protein
MITQALNMAPPKIADYGTLLKKLKKEFIESTLVSIDKKTKKTNKLPIQPTTNCNFWMCAVTKDILGPSKPTNL